MRCEKALCRAALEITIDRLGRTIARCPTCARRRAGRCVQCNAPRWSKHRWGKYCVTCAKAANDRAGRKYQANNVEMLREKARVRMAKRRQQARAGRALVSGTERAAHMNRWLAEHSTPEQRKAIASRASKARWQKFYQRQMLRKMQEHQERR